MIPPIIIRELNRHKDGHPIPRLRKRAQGVLAKLYEFATDGNLVKLRDKVELKFTSFDPQIEFAAHQLRIECHDDWLIASILDCRNKWSLTDFALVTQDLGLVLKARNSEIPTMSLPDDLKLPEELDAAEKRIRDLESEIRAYQNAAPKLRLSFEDGESTATFTLKRSVLPTAEDNRIEMERIRATFPKRLLPYSDQTPQRVTDLIQVQSRLETARGKKVQRLYSRKEAQEYENRMDLFYDDYDKFLDSVRDYKEAACRTITVKLALQNGGTCPAEDIRIRIQFPNGFRLLEELPDSPEAPEPPKTKWEELEEQRHALTHLASFRGFGTTLSNIGSGPSNVSSPTIRQTNSYEVEVDVGRLNHHFSEAIAPLHLIFDTFDLASSFGFDYKIFAANVPGPSTGRLNVVIHKEG